MRKNFEDNKRDFNRSSNTLIKRRENQFLSLGRSGHKMRYNVQGVNPNSISNNRILPKLGNNAEKYGTKPQIGWSTRPEAQKW